MELTPIDGGKHTGSNESVARRSFAPFPGEVAKALSYLANLIDDEIELRGVGIGVREFAASFLGTPLTGLVVTTQEVGILDFQLTALALAEDLRDQPPAAVIGEDQEEPPRWERLSLGEHEERIPYELAAAFQAGQIADVPLVVEVRHQYGAQPFIFKVYSRTADASVAEQYLDGLRSRAADGTNPFRRRTLETKYTRMGLTFRVKEIPASQRADVVLPPNIWAEVDRNVHGLFAGLGRLEKAGLSRNRGVLLSGPPGTGKTALCRALANEVSGQVTVVFCDAVTVAAAIGQLYEEMCRLAPALVVMEDVDLVVGNRGQASGMSLMDFLVALDGAMSNHAGVVTIATTNDSAAIDPAAKRSARFDVEIEVPAPNLAGREAILRRYLRDLDVEVDSAAVAAVTSGSTGADLRELVSDAVLHVAEAERIDADREPIELDTSLLVRLARRRHEPDPTGRYL